MADDSDDVKVSVMVTEISTSICFYFQHSYLSIFVLFFFSAFLLSTIVRRITDPGFGPGLVKAILEFIRIKFQNNS